MFVVLISTVSMVPITMLPLQIDVEFAEATIWWQENLVASIMRDYIIALVMRSAS